ncbi:MAG: hypothetical protein IJE04_03445 [Bacilli bacterium]|nr:hypothetical protein [Bacilli bacterium]
MILKRPYAFFIKMFKPIHLILSGLVLYLLYLTNNILEFLNNYIYSSDNIIEADVLSNLINKLLYVIPIIVIILFLLLLGIMYKKNKSVTFYFMGIFSFIAILVVNTYAVNFLNILVDNIISVKSIKLIRDLVLINIIIESLIFILLFIRAIGLDFKKFNFDSDISKIDISESDKEEFEINVNIDFNEKKRKTKERIRNLRYIYSENKFIINISLTLLTGIFIFVLVFFINKSMNVNKEGVYYSSNFINFKVNDTIILNTDYQGNKITDNYLIVVRTDIKSNYSRKTLYLNDFSLKVENIVFKPVTKYLDSLIDLGNFYDEQVLSLDYKEYLFVYEIPKKYINSDMYFSYNNEGNLIDILLQPKNLVNNEVLKTININETLKFEGALNGVEFKINKYYLNDKFELKYNYCIKENDCISSKEYLKPSIDENYDKVILKLNVDYNSSSELDVDSFYKILSKFGTVLYKISDNWFAIYKFEEITSKRVSTQKDVYIGINSNIMDADSIKIVFNVRGLKYEYILK